MWTNPLHYPVLFLTSLSIQQKSVHKITIVPVLYIKYKVIDFDVGVNFLHFSVFLLSTQTTNTKSV
jgi:hypothetical protein